MHEHGTHGARYAAADGRAPAWADFISVANADAALSCAPVSKGDRRVYSLDYDSGEAPTGQFALFLGFTPPSIEVRAAHPRPVLPAPDENGAHRR